MTTKPPLVFACSGCSPAGRLAYDVAQELDRRGEAEMSCLAGVGAAIPRFLHLLQDREVWVIDGCPIHCALGVFRQAGRDVDTHVRLHEFGVRKNQPVSEGPSLDRVVSHVLQDIHGQKQGE